MICQENLKASFVNLVHIMNMPLTAKSLKEASRGLNFGMVYHYVKMSNPFYGYFFLVRHQLEALAAKQVMVVGRLFWSKRF